jgi:hypothetical protein
VRVGVRCAQPNLREMYGFVGWVDRREPQKNDWR